MYITLKSIKKTLGKYIEYTDHKNYVMTDVLTSCRMSLLNHLQYKFI